MLTGVQQYNTVQCSPTRCITIVSLTVITGSLLQTLLAAYYTTAGWLAADTAVHDL